MLLANSKQIVVPKSPLAAQENDSPIDFSSGDVTRPPGDGTRAKLNYTFCIHPYRIFKPTKCILSDIRMPFGHFNMLSYCTSVLIIYSPSYCPPIAEFLIE